MPGSTLNEYERNVCTATLARIRANPHSPEGYFDGSPGYAGCPVRMTGPDGVEYAGEGIVAIATLRDANGNPPPQQP